MDLDALARNGPKILAIVGGLSLAIMALRPASWEGRWSQRVNRKVDRLDWWLLGIATAAMLVAIALGMAREIWS